MHRLFLMKENFFLKIPESKTGEILMIQKKVKEQEIPPEVDLAVIPTVWETNITGKSKLAEPVKIDLKEGTGTARIKQYLIKSEVRQELKKLIDKFLEYTILEECESEYNTPILPAPPQKNKKTPPKTNKQKKPKKKNQKPNPRVNIGW